MYKYDLVIANLQNNIIEYLVKKYQYQNIKDLGCYDTCNVDYPDYAKKVCDAILHDETSKGILICNTGIGMSIVANRYSGIRAALCLNESMASMSREHNDANIIIFGSQFVDKSTACNCCDVFLTTRFEGGRHVRRLDKIN